MIIFITFIDLDATEHQKFEERLKVMEANNKRQVKDLFEWISGICPNSLAVCTTSRQTPLLEYDRNKEFLLAVQE